MRTYWWIVFFLFSVYFMSTEKLSANSNSKKSFTVVIDPGHGGHDPGAMYHKIKEKDIVLNLAIKLGRYIDQEIPDVNIVYTRKTDVFIPLFERAEKAIKSKADLFVSLHANSCPTPSVTGTETFVLGMHKTQENLEVAKKENSVILIEDNYSTTYAGFDPNSSESYIMFDLVQEEYFNQSVSLAALVQNGFKSHAKRIDRGVKQAGFLVLRETSMPSVLIEAGYLSNAKEAAYLNSDKGQDQLAYSICGAIKQYKASFETKNEINLIADQAQTTNENSPGMKSQPEQQQSIQASANLQQAPPIADKKRPVVTYSIQLAATHNNIALKSYNFKGLKSVFMIENKGLYKYFYGKESSYDQIEKRKTEARKVYPDAFVTAFVDNKQVSVKEAKILQAAD